MTPGELVDFRVPGSRGMATGTATGTANSDLVVVDVRVSAKGDVVIVTCPAMTLPRVVPPRVVPPDAGYSVDAVRRHARAEASRQAARELEAAAIGTRGPPSAGARAPLPRRQIRLPPAFRVASRWRSRWCSPR